MNSTEKTDIENLMGDSADKQLLKTSQLTTPKKIIRLANDSKKIKTGDTPSNGKNIFHYICHHHLCDSR